MNALAGPILLVGSGKMGTALLRGWLDRGLVRDDVLVVDPAAGNDDLMALRVTALTAPDAIPQGCTFRAIVFAVKPQMMGEVLPAYREVVASGALVISIAAGTVIGRFEEMFGETTPVVRAMPNTPAAIGKGATALFANAQVDDQQRGLAEALMAAVGQVHWLEDEEQMHAVTAMSGGGPAYVFLLIETLARAGIAGGLPEELAWPMARTTVIGSGALAAASDEPAATLRENVTSPGGTTQAALEVLMADEGIQALFDRAIRAAAERSVELA
ncbi:MAG: pyrroline-5-carboxylate reductase [Alphaproteobacteria bacterium]|nr:pyrroline-5-carboxylate reductase [Alphaproteobacteria bacterium]